VKKVAKKAKKHAAHAPAAAAAGAKMSHACPKGCSVVDAPGKCPKCSADLVAIGGAAKKAEKAVKAAPAAAKEAVKEAAKQ
jgi:hypothetical protein